MSVHKALRGGVRQADVDAGTRPGLTTRQTERIGQLEVDNRRLRAANAIGKRIGLLVRPGLDRLWH